MANIELKASTQDREILKEENGGFESDDFSNPDDSDEDPTFDFSEDTRLSKISLKKSRPGKVKEMDSESEDGEESSSVDILALHEKDGKCFKKVEELIKDGHLEKLKLEQCKVYLRKYGLRLSGNKGILIERIKEHLEVINGGGQKKYPISSFVFNCKGDACTGDVVMFEQKVYEMFNIASRSATSPPCGTRVVAGRIVKESYGAAKQQHTFTIEVLWSTGEKPLPPLHPLLIKGRNLYRVKTLRQQWPDEEKRRKVLQEKHSRGFVARNSRDIRIKEKEMMKTGQRVRVANTQQIQFKLGTIVISPQQQLHYQEMAAKIVPQQIQNYQHPVNVIQDKVHQQQNIQQQKLQHLQKEHVPKPQEHVKRAIAEQHNKNGHIPKPLEFQGTHLHYQPHWSSPQKRPPHQTSLRNFHHRRSLSSNNCMWKPPQQTWAQPRQQCWYYRQGSCYHGENCKYLHD